MFTQKGLLLFIFICFPVAYVANTLDNNGLVLIGFGGTEYHIMNTVATYSFIVGCACAGLFLLSVFALGILPIMPGIGKEEKEEELIFTKNELIEMDREDAPVHNDGWRSTANNAEWGPYDTDGPVYEDYDGYLRRASDNAFIHDNGTSKRRVRNGKVSSKYERLPDGRYRYKK